MKLLTDLLPVLLFFVVFKIGEAHREAAAVAGTQWFGWMVSGGIVTASQAPILWATLIAIVVTAAQIGLRLARGKPVDRMLWIGLAVIVVFGGATIWFHNETFIKWKPTVLYWAFGTTLVVGRLGFRRNLVQSLMQTQIALPAAVWRRLDLAWIAFFSVMGLVNLYVAYRYPTDTWVSFKLFGLLGLTLAFIIAQAFWLSRHVQDEQAPADHGHRS